MPATVAGILAALHEHAPAGKRATGAPLPPGRRSPGPPPPAPARRFDLELLAVRPLHHPLELAGLLGLLDGLAAAAPRLRLRLWFRSALADDAPFAALAAAERRRLPGPGAAAGAAALAEMRAGGALVLLLGTDAAWERRLRQMPAWRRVRLPRDFQWRLPEGPRVERAVHAYRTALAAAAPRWLAPRMQRRPCGGPVPPLPAPAAIRRILIHQARSHVGDALWLTPLLCAIRERFPRATVTVLAAEGQAEILAASGLADEILILPPAAAPRGAAATPPADLDAATTAPAALGAAATAPAGASAATGARPALLALLAERRFDAALFAFLRRPRSRWLAAAAAALRIPWRINLEYFSDAVDGRRRSPLFTHEGWFFWGSLPSPRLLRHALDPLATPTAPPPDGDARCVLPLPAAWRRDAARVLAATGIGIQPFAVLAPGARSSARWPARRFAALAVHLARDLGLHVLIEGGPGDAEPLDLVEQWVEHWVQHWIERQRAGAPMPRAGRGFQFAAGAPPPGRSAGRILVRRDPLGTLAALLARAALLVGNDSAPIHLAALADTPTLYFAHREKLVHSHPAAPHTLALFDAARNRPARIPLSAATAAIRAIGALHSQGAIPTPSATPAPGALRAPGATTAPSAATGLGASPRPAPRPCGPSFCMLHFLQQTDRLLLPIDGAAPPESPCRRPPGLPAS